MKRLALAMTFVLVITLTAFGDCPTPGEMQTPPCTSAIQIISDDTSTSTEATSNVQTPDDTFSDVTVDLLLSALQLF